MPSNLEGCKLKRLIDVWERMLSLIGYKNPKDFDYKWVRTHLYGEPDEANVLRHEQQGWTPVPDNALPEHLRPQDRVEDRWDNSLLKPHERNEYKGMRLYRLPKKLVEEGRAYRNRHAVEALRKADTHYMREEKARSTFVYGVKTSLRDQINEYYSEANRKEHPERQQEYEDSERRLQAKGLSFN